MQDQREQRKFPRMSITSGDYGIRFQVMGIPILDSRLVNLSASGCGMEVGITDVRLLDVGDILDGLHLDHPDLPAVPLSALVMRLLGKVPGKMSGYVLVGVEFQGITPFVRNLIAEHVSTHLAEE